MDSKIELYASLCSVLERPEPKKEIWDILAGYTINALAAYSSLETSIKEFLDAKRADSLSEKSILNYKQILNLFQQWKDIPPSLITTDDIRGWMSYLKNDRGMKKDSVQTYLNCLRSFFGWLYSEEKFKVIRPPESRAHILIERSLGSLLLKKKSNFAVPFSKTEEKKPFLKCIYRLDADCRNLWISKPRISISTLGN